jgi:hypothetical protein
VARSPALPSVVLNFDFSLSFTTRYVFMHPQEWRKKEEIKTKEMPRKMGISLPSPPRQIKWEFMSTKLPSFVCEKFFSSLNAAPCPRNCYLFAFSSLPLSCRGNNKMFSTHLSHTCTHTYTRQKLKFKDKEAFEMKSSKMSLKVSTQHICIFVHLLQRYHQAS